MNTVPVHASRARTRHKGRAKIDPEDALWYACLVAVWLAAVAIFGFKGILQGPEMYLTNGLLLAAFTVCVAAVAYRTR